MFLVIYLLILVCQGIIYRFKFLMLVTLTCAAMTVISFILTQVRLVLNDQHGGPFLSVELLKVFPNVPTFLQFSEGHWHWGDYTLQIHSAFLTGIYGMWNLYVFTIIFLYAPSYKLDTNKSGHSRHAGRSHVDFTVRGPVLSQQIHCELNTLFLSSCLIMLTEMTERPESQETQPTETYRITGKIAEE